MEFALVMIVLLALLYGIMEISRLVLIRSELSNAAREGVQYASLHPNRDADCIKLKAIDPKLSVLSPGAITVGRPQVQIAPFLPITVTVATTWQSLINFVPDPGTLSLKPLGPITMQSSSMKLIENASADATCP